MRIGIECMVFCLCSADLEKESLGLEVPLDACFVRRFMFYNVDHVSPYKDDDRYSVLSVGGENYIIDEDYDSLVKRIGFGSVTVNN